MDRWMTVGLVLVIAGLTAIALALFAGSVAGAGSASNASGQNRNGAIDPVAPLDPRDKNAPKLKDDPLAGRGDPFASSFGATGPRKVTVRVSASGTVLVAIRYRDGRKSGQIARGTFTETRTVKGGSPHAAVGIQIAGDANRGTCTILIDGVKVTSSTIRKPWGVTFCTG